jgi:hypothetical protein
MSKQSSNPVRGLRYEDNNATVGVRHLQDLGVKYVMVRTSEAKAAAAENSDLSFVATSYPWDVYEVQGSDLVVPLNTQPVVVRHRGGDQRERNLELGTSWFQNPDEWAAMPADDGPDSWQRIDAVVDTSRRETNDKGEKTRVDVVVPGETINPVAEPAAEVSNVKIEEQSLSFDVDQTGVPVLVKVSYFPNWQVSGAEGPYRIGPNMMVVVPTSNHVELTYGRTPIDYVTMLLSLVGICLCFVWRRKGDVVHAGELPVASWWRRTPHALPDDGWDPGSSQAIHDVESVEADDVGAAEADDLDAVDQHADQDEYAEWADLDRVDSAPPGDSHTDPEEGTSAPADPSR